MDDPQNRPGIPPADAEAPARPAEVPAPHPVAAGSTSDIGTSDLGTTPGPTATEPIVPAHTVGGGDTSDDTKDVAREQGEKVADDAREQAAEVVDTARQGAAEVIDEAKHQAIDLAEDARQQLHRQARQQTDHLGGVIQDLGHKLHALADGRTDETGQVADYTDRVADQVDRIGDRVQELGFDGTVEELQRFARRRPGVFLLGAAAAGFAVARLGRGAKDAQQQPEAGDDRSSPHTGQRPLPSSGPSAAPARAGRPPVAGSPTAPDPTAPAVGGPPSDVPPPPPVVPAPDPTMPRGRP